MAYADLREWIAHLEANNQLVRITREVDWNLEIGGIARLVLRQQGPALLFENIRDYQTGRCRKFFTNGLGNKTNKALALNLPPESSDRQITESIRTRLRNPIAPQVVASGPVKEVVVPKEAVNLLEFPVPKYNSLDGGRYINTFCSIVTRDPDTGQLNVGIYRGMVVDPNQIGVLLATNQHWGQHFTKYRDRGEEMPIAVVYGWDPTLLMLSATPIVHHGSSEYDYVGGLREAPVQLVQCELSDIMVPATAEIVLEGYISPDPETFKMEGPFGEYTGTYGGLTSPKPCIRVECITHRQDPIYRGGVVGNSPGNISEDFTHVKSAITWNHLEDSGVPNIRGVWGNPVSVSNLTRVQIKKTYRGQAKQVAMAIWANNLSSYGSKYVIVVDEDIDAFDHDAIDWAMSYRTNAEMDDIQFFHGCFGSMLDPSTPLHQRNVQKYGQGKTSRVLIDATVNWELEPMEQYGGKRFPDLCTALPPAIEEMVKQRWTDYGLDPGLKP